MEKNIHCYLQDEKSHGLRTQRDSCNTKKMTKFPTIFWVKKPRHSEENLAKKRYTSIVARVFFRRYKRASTGLRVNFNCLSICPGFKSGSTKKQGEGSWVQRLEVNVNCVSTISWKLGQFVNTGQAARPTYTAVRVRGAKRNTAVPWQYGKKKKSCVCLRHGAWFQYYDRGLLTKRHKISP